MGDYGQIELRVLAHFSKDPHLIKAFLDGEDIHQATADVLGTPRSLAKNINFLIPYGGGPGKIVATTRGEVDLDTATEFYELHKKRFPAVWRWIEQTHRVCAARNPPHVKTIYGRKRRLPEIRMRGDNDYARQQRSAARRMAVNSVIQGTAADIIKRSMVRIHDALDPDMHLILSVHDELVVETPTAKAERAVEIMREAMVGEEMQILRVPLEANIKVAASWDAAK